MPPELPPGRYMFIDADYDRDEMSFVEAPADLEALFKEQAAVNGQELVRDAAFELRCLTDAMEAVFWIYWPRGTQTIHVFVPRRFANGRA